VQRVSPLYGVTTPMDASNLTAEQWEAFMDLPASAAPEGVTPMFDNPPNNNQLAIPVISVFLALTTVFAFIRAYSRIVKLRSVQLEDCKSLHTYCSPVRCKLTRCRCCLGFLRRLLFSTSPVFVEPDLDQGLFVGLVYGSFALAVDVGLYVHQWHLQLRKMPRFSYVRIPHPDGVLSGIRAEGEVVSARGEL
jgi:hypothetical protein